MFAQDSGILMVVWPTVLILDCHHPFIAGVSKNNIDMEIVLVMIITTLLKHNHLLLLMPTLLQNYI